MDTPLKATRRKLKKIMKKSRANLSVSTNSIYQKKLKSAINVSLNSTRTVRTLQSNNRSLATSLEKMRQDFRQVHDHYGLLLEENHELREKILELQRINVSEKYIDQEVEKRVEERMDLMKRKLVLLGDIATRFLDILAELSDICVSSKSSTLDDLSSTESANQNYSLLPNLPPISSDVSLDCLSDLEFTQSSHSTEAEMEYGDLEKNIVSRRNNGHHDHEMTAIMEQSMLCPATDIYSTVNILERVPAYSSLDKKSTTKLPVRIAKPLSQTETQANDQGGKSIGELNKRKSAGSPKQVARRQTFVVEKELRDDSLITNVETPQFLVSDCLPEDEAFDINVQGQVTTPATPTRAAQLNEKGLKRSSSLKKRILKRSHRLTPPGKEQSPSQSNPLQQQIPSPKGTKLSSKQRGTRSRTRQSPKKSPTSNKEQLSTKQMSSLVQKSTVITKKRNAASPSKTASAKPEDKQPPNYFICNEFKLSNVHKNRLEASNAVNYSSIIPHQSPSLEIGEQTIFPGDDMEYTRMEDSMAAPHCMSVKQSLPDGGSINTNSTELTSHSRSRSKQSDQVVGDGDGPAEEKIPDAVTMRCTKPGQMMFAAARKESDGTRKNVPLVSKVRSKSKKKIAEMMENMVDTEPETIFDFHDKTPSFLNNEKQKATSVFNFSADQSKLSPLTPLSKNRSRNRKSTSSSNDVSSKTILQSQSSSNDLSSKTAPQSQSSEHEPKDCILIEVSVPLKDDSPPANSTLRTRSRSRGRQQHVKENGAVKVKARSPSRKRRAKCNAESPTNDQTSSSSVTCSETLFSDCSSSVTKTASQSQSSEHEPNDFNPKDCILTEVSVPLKGDSPPANSMYGMRSRSLGRQQHVNENDAVKVKVCSSSRKRRVNKTESPTNDQTSSSSVTCSETLFSDCSSSVTKTASQSQSSEHEPNDFNPKDCILIEVSVPLKGDSPPANSMYGMRSRSLGRQQHVNEKNAVKVKTRSSSRKRRVNKTESPTNDQTSSSSVTCSETLFSDCSSPAAKYLYSKHTKNDVDFKSVDVNDKPIPVSHSTSDALCKQNENGEDLQRNGEKTVRNRSSKSHNNIVSHSESDASCKQKEDGEEDLHVERKDIVENRTSKSCTKVLPKRPVYDKGAEQNDGNQTNEDKSAILASAHDELIVSVMQEEIEKKCMDIVPSSECDSGDFYDTSTKIAGESQSVEHDKEAVVVKKKTANVTSRKTRSKSLPKSAGKIDANDLESDMGDCYDTSTKTTSESQTAEQEMEAVLVKKKNMKVTSRKIPSAESDRGDFFDTITKTASDCQSVEQDTIADVVKKNVKVTSHKTRDKSLSKSPVETDTNDLESDMGDCYDTSTKTTTGSQSEAQDTEAVVKKKTVKVPSHKTRENYLPISAADIDANDSGSEFSGNTNFINTRRERTKGMKENKGNKNQETKNEDKREKDAIDDLAAIVDNAAQTVALVDVSNAVKVNLEIPVETGQLLEQLKRLRTPEFSHRDYVQSAVATPSDKGDSQKKKEQAAKVSRIVRGTPPGRSQSVPKRPGATNSPESEAGAKRRRAATHVNYAEMNLNKKMRRGDPFTSHYCTGDKIAIFKSPKSKKKKVKERKLGSLHNQSISEELAFPSEGNV
ncbi:hypothetical protein BsWGS_01802 [Bradybaena similaris]